MTEDESDSESLMDRQTTTGRTGSTSGQREANAIARDLKKPNSTGIDMGTISTWGCSGDSNLHRGHPWNRRIGHSSLQDKWLRNRGKSPPRGLFRRYRTFNRGLCSLNVERYNPGLSGPPVQLWASTPDRIVRKRHWRGDGGPLQRESDWELSQWWPSNQKQAATITNLAIAIHRFSVNQIWEGGVCLCD